MDLMLNDDFLLSFLLMVLALVACGIGMLRLFNHSLPPVYPTPEPLPIRGWLIVIAIWLGWISINYFFGLFRLRIWNDDFWTFPPFMPATRNYYLQLSMDMLRAVYVMFAFCGAGFSLFLLLKRRDIFPKVVSWYMIITAGVYCLLMLISRLTSPPRMEFIVIIEWVNIIMSILIAWLIVRYVNRSVRSKETFVLPHPSLVDHEYPDFEFNKDAQ